MTSRPANPLKSILHPYVFILKEGGEIKKDFLDYSLMILLVHSRETLRSPTHADSFKETTLPTEKKIVGRKKAPLFSYKKQPKNRST